MQPIKVLHSFGSLNIGGIETWLMNIIRQKSDEIKFDFVLRDSGGALEEEVKGYGCKIYYYPHCSRLQKYLNSFGLGNRFDSLRGILLGDNYDAFHIHGEEFMGDAVRVAASVKVPVRIVHCHGTVLCRGRKGLEIALRGVRFKTIDRQLILRYATDIVVCSNEAGRFLVGNHWKTDPRCCLFYCGVPLDQFKAVSTKWASRQEFRQAHNIPADALVIGHIGSMGLAPVKNHFFLLDIFAQLARRNQRYLLYLVGDGPLRPEIIQAVKARGLENRVLIPGLCNDISSLMVHGFDIFILPSLGEGLPIAGLEAVASGLYTICSDTITADFTNYFRERVMTVSLSASASHWADLVEEAFGRRINLNLALDLVEKSPFSITSSLYNLINFYKQSLQG